MIFPESIFNRLKIPKLARRVLNRNSKAAYLEQQIYQGETVIRTVAKSAIRIFLIKFTKKRKYTGILIVEIKAVGNLTANSFNPKSAIDGTVKYIETGGL